MASFKIKHLDHVAIRVADLERSVEWYNKVLGLEIYRVPEWNGFPIFMLAGQTGVAIFPANIGREKSEYLPPAVKIYHFAFNVDRTEFEKAKKHYEKIGIEFNFQDHHYFYSIYTRDPDGHIVELTCLVKEASSFYEDLKVRH